MTVKPISLRKSLGRKQYNSFLNKFLMGGLIQTLRNTAPYELSVEQAKELSDLVARNRFTVEEAYRDDVGDGLGFIFTVKFENGYTLSSFGKFLRKNTDKLERGGKVEDFLFSSGYRGVPKAYHSIQLDKDLAFRCSELIDVARDNGKTATPKKENVVKAIARYGIIEPGDETRKTLKEDQYSTYFKETFFDKVENTGFEDLVEKFSALGANLDRQRKSIVHNDLHRKNLLRARDKNSSTKVIDWDDAVIGAIQKDLWRVNMSVYYHNCLDHKQERDASIRTLHDALDSSMRNSDKSGKGYPDDFETFRRNYLTVDVLENLNFAAKGLAYTKQLAKKGDDDASLFFKQLTDLVYTRALDSLNEMGETEKEMKLQELGSKNGMTRLSPEERRQYEREQPDRRVGSLRAQMELSDEMIDEQRRLFNQAVNRRNLKSKAKTGFLATTIAGGILGLLGYAAEKYLMPLTEVWKANSFISVKAEDDDHDETSEVMITRPEEIDMINSLHPDMEDVDELEKNPKTKELIDGYKKRRDKAYETIDSILNSDKPWTKKHLLTENILSPEEKQQIADEYLAIISRICNLKSNDPFIEINRQQLAEYLKNGLFSASTISELISAKDLHIGVELTSNQAKGTPNSNTLSEAANAAINSTEDFIRFFSQHSARPELTALLQQAYEKHTNSPVVKNEKLKALPPGTLDALIFVDMLTENAIPYNLDKYVKSLGHNTELLRQDKFFAGYLASYAADLLRKHKDIATVFAICTNGELDVQNAITCAGSTNFFEYKQFLDDNGANAELAWFYFARKNLHVDPAMVALEFETYDFIRNNEKESIRFGALSRRMEEILKKMRTRTSKYKELASTMQRDVDENITDIKRKLSETREMFEHHDSLNKTYTQYSEDPSFCQEHPAEAEEIRAFLPTIRTLVNYERAQFLWGTTICRAYERMKNLSTEELKAEKDKLIQMTRRQETYLNELGSKLEPDKIKVLTDNSDRLTETIRQYAERQK